jgi:hypothetical protein
MKKTTRLIGAVAIAMVLSIAFSGVATASWLAELTPENKIGYDNGNFNAIKTTTKVGMTDDPVLNYKIYAEGLNDGSMATGRISAGMRVYVVGDSILSYVERSTASGSFQFHKVMSYTSKITTP